MHHVIARGIERREIFCDPNDRNDFLARLARVADDFGLLVYAWGLMPNHFHLLARSGEVGVSRSMQRLLSGYALRFNRRHERCGHLFQNRFKSTLVDSQAYLLELVRYIHLNPVRAGLVSLDDLDHYPWTGHAALLGRTEIPPWLDARTVLEQFTPELRAAQTCYREFVHAGMAASSQPPPDGGVRLFSDSWSFSPVVSRGREAWAFVERVMGTPVFVDMLRQTLAPANPAALRHRVDVEQVLRETAARFGLSRQELVSGGRCRRISRARNAALSDLVRCGGLSFTQSAKLLNTSKWTAARAIKR